MQRIRYRARRLRREATDAERLLWYHLRRRQLAGARFRRQHPIVGFIADFACIEAGLVVELDGGQHTDRAAYDTERTRRLEAEGYRVLRFWNDDVFVRTADVLAEIHRHLVSQDR